MGSTNLIRLGNKSKPTTFEAPIPILRPSKHSERLVPSLRQCCIRRKLRRFVLVETTQLGTSALALLVEFLMPLKAESFHSSFRLLGALSFHPGDFAKTGALRTPKRSRRYTEALWREAQSSQKPGASMLLDTSASP